MSIQEQFNQVSEQYDGQRKILIPCFDDFYGMAIENVNLTTREPKIIDLGAGTGILSQKILEKYPLAKITLIDLSDKMLDVARRRFEGIDNVQIETADFTNYSIEHESCDAIVSSLAIHHLNDKDKYLLYEKIFHGLKSSGTFINAEQVAGENNCLEQLYHKRWVHKIENSSLTREELDASYERIKLDKRSSLSSQLEWLKKIGFENVDCLYKYYDFAVIWAKK